MLRRSWLIDNLVYQISIDQGFDNARPKVDMKPPPIMTFDRHTPYATAGQRRHRAQPRNFCEGIEYWGLDSLGCRKEIAISACLDGRRACLDL